jgi:hypothetical protein
MTVKRAYALMAKRSLLPRVGKTGAVELALPEFREYEVVVVETQPPRLAR